MKLWVTTTHVHLVLLRLYYVLLIWHWTLYSKIGYFNQVYIYIYIYIYSRRRTRWTWVVVTQSFTRYAIIRQLVHLVLLRLYYVLLIWHWTLYSKIGYFNQVYIYIYIYIYIFVRNITYAHWRKSIYDRHASFGPLHHWGTLRSKMSLFSFPTNRLILPLRMCLRPRWTVSWSTSPDMMRWLRPITSGLNVVMISSPVIASSSSLSL